MSSWISQSPKFAEAARAAQQAYLVDMKAPERQVVDAVKATGVSADEARQIANEVQVGLMADHFSGAGGADRLQALDVDVSALGNDVITSVQWAVGRDLLRGNFFDLDGQGRIEAVIEAYGGRGGAQLRADAAAVQGDIGAFGAQARMKLGQQATDAGKRLDFVATVIGVSRDELMAGLEGTLITPEKADALVQQSFGAHVDGDASRIANGFKVVSADEFVSLYRQGQDAGLGFLSKAVRGLTRRLKNDGIPRMLPAVVHEGKTLIPGDAERLGKGAVLAHGLVAYKADDADAVLGKELTGLLRSHLAEQVNATFDPRFQKAKAEGRDTSFFRKDVVSEWGAESPAGWHLSEHLGTDAMAEGFFKDPSALRGAIESTYGEGATDHLNQLIADVNAAPTALDGTELSKALWDFCEEGPDRVAKLPGIRADVVGNTPEEREAISASVVKQLGAGEAEGTAALAEALDAAPDKVAMAEAILLAVASAGTELPRPAVAKLAAAVTGRAIFKLLADNPSFEGKYGRKLSPGDLQMAATDRQYDDELPTPSAEVMAALNAVIAPHAAAATEQLRASATSRAADEGAHAKRLGQAFGEVLAQHGDPAKVADAIDAAFVDSKLAPTEAFMWAALGKSEVANLRYDLDDGKVIVAKETENAGHSFVTAAASAALELSQHDAFAEAFPPDLAKRARTELQNRLMHLPGASADARAAAGYVDGAPDFRSPHFRAHFTFESAIETHLQKQGLDPASDDMAAAATGAWADLVLGGKLDLFREAVDGPAGAGTFDRLLKMLGEPGTDLEQLSDQLRDVAHAMRDARPTRAESDGGAA
jgi:hypothetical protein